MRSGAVDIVVIDSVAALTPRAEIEGEMGDSFVGLHARMMSQAMRKLAGSIAKSQCVAIFINQLREKVGVIYGNPEVTTGGRALKFYASVRMEVRRMEHLKNGTELIGSHTRVKVVKNKVAPPFKEAEFDIMYGEGISRTSELVDLGVKYGLVNKSGAWFSMGDTRLGQGRDAAKQYFKEHPDIAGCGTARDYDQGRGGTLQKFRRRGCQAVRERRDRIGREACRTQAVVCQGGFDRRGRF